MNRSVGSIETPPLAEDNMDIEDEKDCYNKSIFCLSECWPLILFVMSFLGIVIFLIGKKIIHWRLK